MCMHEEILTAVLPLIKKYDLEMIDLLGQMAYAMHIMSEFKTEKLIEMYVLKKDE